MELRRELAWNQMGLDTFFHASEDKQDIRDRVFPLLQEHHFRIDATILEKAKAQPQIRHSEEYFYQLAWYLHFKYVAPRITRLHYKELLVVSASVGTKKKRAGFRQAVDDVVSQVARSTTCRVACWDCASEPCLQIADYCCWAIQRKWESAGADIRSYDLIKDKIASEFVPFRGGKVSYY